jgi:hypothetical protein
MAPRPSAKQWIQLIVVAAVGTVLAQIALATLFWMPKWMKWVFYPGEIAAQIAGKLGPSGNFPNDPSIISFVVATWLAFVSATLILWLIGRRTFRAIRGRSGGAR